MTPNTSSPSPSANVGWYLTALVLVLAVALGNWFGLGLALLIVAGGVLVGSISIFWSSLNNLAGQAPLSLEEAVNLGAPTSEEERKRAILRALKDLEYERDIGKINAADYAQLSERYRMEAKLLLQSVDRDLDSERQRGEQLLEVRLKQRKTTAETKSTAAGTELSEKEAAK